MTEQHTDSKQSPTSRVYTRREALRTGSLVGGGAIFGGLVWEAVRGPVLRRFSPEQRIILPDWHERNDLVNVPWVSFVGDPKATGDQSKWGRAGIAAVPTGSLVSLLLAKGNEGSVPAAAFQEEGDKGKVTSLGSVPNLGIVTEKDETRAYAVAFMIGHGAVNVSLGILQPDGAYIGAADTLPFVEIKLDDLAHQFEGLPVLKG